MKTSELTGVALDWAVAKCEGKVAALEGGQLKQVGQGFKKQALEYASNWSQGGPIIEREKLEIDPYESGEAAWRASRYRAQVGPTLLIAAMRCYVASKLGDEVDVPEELLK